MKTGTWLMSVTWLVSFTVAGVGFALGWFDALTAALIVLVAFPLGAEVRSIRSR